jgi:hypothetical protein
MTHDELIEQLIELWIDAGVIFPTEETSQIQSAC